MGFAREPQLDVRWGARQGAGSSVMSALDLPGSALYVIQMDLDAALDDEFERWNDEEHIRERLGCPGFLRASRYRLDPQGRPVDPAAPAAAGRHMTIYELSDPKALLSEEYARRTSTPSEWTQRIAPNLQVRSRGVYVRTQVINAD